MAAGTNYVISYDISSNRLRNLLAKLLAKTGCERWQKSVFVAIDFEKTEIDRLKIQIKQLLANKAKPTDSVLCVPARNLPTNHWFVAGSRILLDENETIIV